MTVWEIIKEVRNHRCPKKMILCSDDPKNRQMGWVCNGCGKKWSFGILITKTGDMPDSVREAIKTVSGRLRLAAILNNQKVVVVTEEEFVGLGDGRI